MEDGMTYKDAGVDIEAQDEAAAMFAKDIAGTHTENVLQGIADFGGMFALGRDYEDPVLVAGTDGVGTKLMIAFQMGRHDTVGQDLVAMCIDDVICQGAEPLFFLDYIGSAIREPEQTAEIVRGIADACKKAGCVLLGGEMAELPGLYSRGEYDLVGFAVGIVERAQIIDGSDVVAGDVVIGLASNGLHSNGYSLARKVLLDVAGYGLYEDVAELGCTVGEELLRPTRIYAPAVCDCLAAGIRPHGLCHITGGGLPENVGRCLPDGLSAIIDRESFPRPAIFDLIQQHGNVDTEEMYRTFNMGIGMAAVCGADDADNLCEVLEAAGETTYRIGEIAEGCDKVRFA